MLSREAARYDFMPVCSENEKDLKQLDNLMIHIVALSCPLRLVFFSPPHCSVSLGSRASSLLPSSRTHFPLIYVTQISFRFSKPTLKPTRLNRHTLPSAVLSKFLLIWLVCFFFFLIKFFSVFLVSLYVYTVHCTAKVCTPKDSGKAMMFTIADSSSAVVQNQQIRHRCASPGF